MTYSLTVCNSTFTKSRHASQYSAVPNCVRSPITRLLEMLTEVGIPIHLACVAGTASKIQWMVKER
jgi:hypothetical protein